MWHIQKNPACFRHTATSNEHETKIFLLFLEQAATRFSVPIVQQAASAFLFIFPLYSLCCWMPAGTIGPLTAQASGSGTHVAAGVQSAAFSLDLSQRQRAANQSLTLQTTVGYLEGQWSIGLPMKRKGRDYGLPGAALYCWQAPAR